MNSGHANELWLPWMLRAQQLAAQAQMYGDVPVGAILLDTQLQELGVGYNRREQDKDPAAHAEVVAIRNAAHLIGDWRLTGATLVVTLEPCVMCAGVIAQARISRVVFGAWDERAGAAGSVWDLLRDRNIGREIEVISGVAAAECTQQLHDFFEKTRRGNKPG